MQPGLVSVMMPAYNAEHYVGEAIRSVLAQTYPDWELLIVNDGSTDDTARVLTQFVDQRIRLFNKANGGESSARNMALDHSRGEFIAYLDADDAYLPQHLAITVGFLRANPQCDAVYTDGFHIDESGRRLASLQSRRRGPFSGRLFEQAVLASDIFGPPLCVVNRHDIVVRHGLRYDTRIVIGPDWDFFIRYASVSTFGYLPDRSCLYRVHQANITSRVDPTRRTSSLALCREKAIGAAGFRDCAVEVRSAVFYDLMVNLLRDQPAQRAAVAEWPEFADLPEAEQGRLLRLMASDALLRGGDCQSVGDWLARATTLNPDDRKACLLNRLFRLSPRLCHVLLRARSPLQAHAGERAPFADLAG